MPTYLTDPIDRCTEETFAREGYICGTLNHSENADYLLPKDAERLRELIIRRMGSSIRMRLII